MHEREREGGAFATNVGRQALYTVPNRQSAPSFTASPSLARLLISSAAAASLLRIPPPTRASQAPSPFSPPTTLPPGSTKTANSHTTSSSSPRQPTGRNCPSTTNGHTQATDITHEPCAALLDKQTANNSPLSTDRHLNVPSQPAPILSHDITTGYSHYNPDLRSLAATTPKHGLKCNHRVKIESPNGQQAREAAGVAGSAGEHGRHTGTGDEMPGRVTMDQPGPIGAQDLKKDQIHAQDGAVPSAGAPVQPHSAPPVNGAHTNGQNGTLPNGVSPANGAASTTNGEHNAVVTALSSVKAPPELDQSWRDGPSNKSLGTLLDRLSQQCYIELNEALTKMQDVQMPTQPAPLINGASTHNAQDTSEASLQKKRILLEFANDQRDRFTKTLVLSDWSRIEKDMARLIDIKVWQDKNRFAHDHARDAIRQLKIDTVAAKMPNPNIEGAIELLATGRAAWVPDFGYVPPKRLTPKRLLRTLRDMNVILATRLNLHDELASHMQEFTVADGRATFSVPEEFEVDLSVADEDPASPFYFIDIRLLFTPSSGALDERLRGFLEGKVNETLATKGLLGCYQFLHNFVLTHKINVLRNQAQDLLQDKWFDCIKFENLRRSLTIQYWATMPGPKSWLEIGIGSGKQQGSWSRKKPTPVISTRWFRRGKLVTEEKLEFDLRDLDLEKMIMAVVAKDSASILQDIKDRILAAGAGSSALSLQLVDSDSMMAEPVLTMSLPSLRSPVVVRIDPITGQYSLTPRTGVTAKAEALLNRDATIDASKWLTSVLCAVAQEQMVKQAELVGWKEDKDRAKQNVLQIFDPDVQQYTLYKCNDGWISKWALGATFSLAGEKWWIVQLGEKPDFNNVSRRHIQQAKLLPTADVLGEQQDICQESLLKIERLAVAEVSFCVLVEELTAKMIPHHIERPKAVRDTQNRDVSKEASSSVYIRFPELMRGGRSKSWKPWALDFVRLTQHGMEQSDDDNKVSAAVRHNLRLTLKGSTMKHLQDKSISAQDKDLAFKAPDGMALRMRAPFGQPFVDQIRHCLRGVETLDYKVGILGNRNFTCTTINQTRLAFNYETVSQLSAQLTFLKDSTRLKLEPSDNPHLRLRVFLERGLNSVCRDPFGTFVDLLPFTLPVMQALGQIENLHAEHHSASVHIHGAACYSLQYKTPFSRRTVRIRSRTNVEGKRATTYWFISIDKKKAEEQTTTDELDKALGEILNEKTEHWRGLANGIVAQVEGVKSVLLKLDETMRGFAIPGAAAKMKESSQANSNPQSAGQNNEVIMLD